MTAAVHIQGRTVQAEAAEVGNLEVRRENPTWEAHMGLEQTAGLHLLLLGARTGLEQVEPAAE